MVSRWSMALLLTAYPIRSATGHRHARSSSERPPVAGDSAGPLLTTAAVCVAVAWVLRGLIAVLAMHRRCWPCCAGLLGRASPRCGGLTGDCYGATNEIVEAFSHWPVSWLWLGFDPPDYLDAGYGAAIVFKYLNWLFPPDWLAGSPTRHEPGSRNPQQPARSAGRAGPASWPCCWTWRWGSRPIGCIPRCGSAKPWRWRSALPPARSPAPALQLAFGAGMALLIPAAWGAAAWALGFGLLQLHPLAYLLAVAVLAQDHLLGADAAPGRRGHRLDTDRRRYC